ncbi:MAG: SDR family oxidoreductase [Armatimonadaceae bacterium]
MSFTGKVALVTGATSGIGKAAALLYAQQGAKVVVSGRREAEGNAVVEEIRAQGGEAIFVRADVTDPQSVQALVETTMAQFGRLDAVFNNAGTEGQFGPLPELDDDVWNQTININLKGVWLLLKHQIPAMLKNGGGAIAINGTIAAEVGMAGTSVYAASKGGVISLARQAAIEYARAGVRVNVINPGPVVTDMLDRAFSSEMQTMMAGMVPVGRLGKPEEIAEAAVWLTSDAASFITGQVLNADGGFTAQ